MNVVDNFKNGRNINNFINNRDLKVIIVSFNLAIGKGEEPTTKIVAKSTGGPEKQACGTNLDRISINKKKEP